VECCQDGGGSAARKPQENRKAVKGPSKTGCQRGSISTGGNFSATLLLRFSVHTSRIRGVPQSGGTMSEFERSLRGYRLMTAEILYHMPDHPELLQAFLWQEFDVAPQFPVLNRFLHFWEKNIEGRLHTVRVAVRGLIAPTELRHAGGEFTLN
jgi:uncharacterized protein Usg